MVKSTKKGKRKNAFLYLLKFFILCISAIFIFISSDILIDEYKSSKIPWQIDYDYSFALASSNAIEDEVDTLRIYRTSGKRKALRPKYIKHKLFGQELVFETKDRGFIRRFISAIQEDIMRVDNCRAVRGENGKGEVFHVVALHEKSMRAGYLFLDRCRTDTGEEYIICETIYSSGLFYNKPLLGILREELHLIKDKQ